MPRPVTVRGAAEMLEFQMWCWGQDVHHPSGNLLLEAGLERHRPPAAAHGSTCYRTRLESGAELQLRGFAVICRAGDEPALMLRRHEFTLRLVPAASATAACWRPTDLPRGGIVRDEAAAATARARFTELAAWMAAYERRVRTTVGADWRRECARRRPRTHRHRLPVPPDALAEHWIRLAEELHLLLPIVSGRHPDTRAS